MKTGNKIVCINTDKFITSDGIDKNKVSRIKENTIYMISGTGANYDIRLSGLGEVFYHLERFITLEKFRKMKINKIINNIIKEN